MYLQTAGYRVSWRLERTAENGPVSEVVDGPPRGVITDVVFEDAEAIVFVMPGDDPLLEEIPVGQACRED